MFSYGRHALTQRTFSKVFVTISLHKFSNYVIRGRKYGSRKKRFDIWKKKAVRFSLQMCALECVFPWKKLNKILREGFFIFIFYYILRLHLFLFPILREWQIRHSLFMWWYLLLWDPKMIKIKIQMCSTLTNAHLCI